MSELPDFLEPMLERIAENEGFVDFTIKVGSGSNIGDNFMGELLSAVITGKRKDDIYNETESKLNLLCKLVPSNAERRKEFQCELAFAQEAYFYNSVAPEFLRFQEEKGLSKKEQFTAFPKCYEAVCDSENGVFAIIMEDLRPDGFEMWPKQKPTPAENSHLVMRELGKFHAISFALKDQRPKQFEKYKELVDILRVFLEAESFNSMFYQSHQRAIDALRDEKHKDIMRDVQKNIKEYSYSATSETIVERHGVVAHGDCWNNNILYRQAKDKNCVEEMRFVDWQMIRYSSPATDLLYNLFTSTDKRTREKEFGQLIRTYHKQLSHNIRKLGSDPEVLFPFDALKNELKLCGNFALVIAPMLIEICAVDPKDLIDLNEACNDGDQQIELIQGLSKNAQLLYDELINGLLEDLTKFGYYHELTE